MFGAKITSIENGKLKRRVWIVWDEKHKKYIVVCKTREKAKIRKTWFLNTLKVDEYLRKAVVKLKHLNNGISLLRLFHEHTSGGAYWQFGICNTMNTGLILDVTDEELKKGVRITLEEIRSCITPNSH